MAVNNNNPIKYSDLVQEDGSILKLIDQVEELRKTYAKALQDINTEAIQLSRNLQTVSGATQQGQRATRSAAAETDRLAVAQRNLERAYDDQAEELARLRLLTNEQNTLTRLTARLNNATEGSYNRLSAQYSLNRVRLNQMTQAQRDNTDAGRELTEQTRRIREEMDQLQRATGNFNLNVGNYPQLGEYTQQLTQAIGLNGRFGDSLRGLAEMGSSGGGISGMFSTMSTSVRAFGATLLTLLANPVFLAIAGIAAVGASFKFWYDYNVGLIEATKLTKQFTGESGNDLKALRNEIQATADTFNQDFKETLIASNALAKQFGISQQEAIKLIQDGFIAGGNANGEFLETLKEYPAYFKEAGVSASEFVAITVQAAKSGIYSDKAVDVINEANKRIREMTKSTADALQGIGLNYQDIQKKLQDGSLQTFDVMQMVSEKLNELPENSAVVGTAIADIFGSQGEDAGLQYLKTLKDIETDLGKVKESAGELGALQQENLESQSELANVTAALFDQTGGFFEGLILQAKTLFNEYLILIIKRVITIANSFINLYNNSMLFRNAVLQISAAFGIVWGVVKTVFTYINNQIESTINALTALATLDLKGVNKYLAEIVGNNVKAAKDIGQVFKDEVDDIVKNSGKKFDPITIPVLVDESGFMSNEDLKKFVDGKGKTKTKTPAKIADYTKVATPKKVTDTTAKDLAEAYKKQLDLNRKYQDAVLELETNSFDQQRQKAIYNYDRQTEDLKYQLATDKKLTAENIKSITDIILTLEKQKTAELTKIENQRNISLLEQQKNAIQLRLDATKKETEAEYKLRLDLLEKERQLELAQNKAKPANEQQSEDGINLKFDNSKKSIDDEFIQRGLMRFDMLQELEQSEFDLLQNSEAKKTRFRLEQEKKRLQMILALNKTMGNQMTQEQVKTYENMIAKLDQEIEKNDRGEGKDIYDLMGLNLDEKKKEAINTSVKFAMDALQSLFDAKVAAADKAVENADKEVDSAERALDAERDARANGYANNVAMAQKELEQAKKNQQKALKEQEKAAKQQRAIQTIQQIGNMVTASTKIWAELGFPWAIPALAVMWGSFAYSKIKAAQTAKANTESYGDGGMIENLTGGSHQSGNDLDFGTKPDGTKRRVEGGETVAVFNKRNSRRYRKVIPDVVKAFNNGSFASKYMSAYDGAKGISLNLNNESQDLSQMKDDVSAIREQNKRKIFTDGNGNTVEVYKNLKRTITT